MSKRKTRAEQYIEDTTPFVDRMIDLSMQLETAQAALDASTAEVRRLETQLVRAADRGMRAESELADARAEVSRLRRLVHRHHSPYEPVDQEPTS